MTITRRRRDYILRMAALARSEPAEFHGTENLPERIMQYAGSAWPRVTIEEVRQVLEEEI